jgi:hypothetical protein
MRDGTLVQVRAMVAISGGRAVFPWQRGQDICDVRRSEDGDHDIYAGRSKGASARGEDGKGDRQTISRTALFC